MSLPEKGPPSLLEIKFEDRSFSPDNKTWKSEDDFCAESLKLKVTLTILGL